MSAKIVLAEADVPADRPVGVTIEGCAPGEHVSLVASWDVTPLAKTRKSAAPDSACDGWCSVVALRTEVTLGRDGTR